MNRIGTFSTGFIACRSRMQVSKKAFFLSLSLFLGVSSVKFAWAARSWWVMMPLSPRRPSYLFGMGQRLTEQWFSAHSLSPSGSGGMKALGAREQYTPAASPLWVLPIMGLVDAITRKPKRARVELCITAMISFGGTFFFPPSSSTKEWSMMVWEEEEWTEEGFRIANTNAWTGQDPHKGHYESIKEEQDEWAAYRCQVAFRNKSVNKGQHHIYPPTSPSNSLQHSNGPLWEQPTWLHLIHQFKKVCQRYWTSRVFLIYGDGQVMEAPRNFVVTFHCQGSGVPERERGMSSFYVIATLVSWAHKSSDGRKMHHLRVLIVLHKGARGRLYKTLFWVEGGPF